MAELVLDSVSLWPKAGREGGGSEPSAIVREISFSVPERETVALIGESGAGKTSVALAIMGMWPGRIEGEIRFSNLNLQELEANAYRELRGRKLVMMMQDPMAALNPALTVGWQLREVLRFRRGLGPRKARREALDWFERVGLHPAQKVAHRYPHELSGGMAQRVLLAIALACRPELLIVDEPFSALDPALVVEHTQLLLEMRAEFNFSILFITHNLSLADEFSSSVIVLRDGEVVESGARSDVFERPRHEYTRQLVEASGLRVKR